MPNSMDMDMANCDFNADCRLDQENGDINFTAAIEVLNSRLNRSVEHHLSCFCLLYQAQFNSLTMKPTTLLLLLLSIPGALSTYTVRFYENASCTQTPGWPAYECGMGEHAFPDAQYVQVENNCGDGKKVFLTLTREDGDGMATSMGMFGCQRIEASIEASIEAEYFTLVCA